ncbi:MAG: pyridoxamine 5'-phosphate oxidase family protein [Pyrinomonadaceae bacterium]
MFIKEMKTEECFEVLTAKRIGRLACVHENQPYIVPFHFAFDGSMYFYAFSTLGQKIEWMRSNPLVCVEVDDMKNQFEWTSLIAFGRYEELPDTPEFEAERTRAYETLSRHPMWWQPVYVARDYRTPGTDDKPIYFRILVEKITGRRGVPDKSSLEMNVGKITANKPHNRFFGFWRSHKPDSLWVNEQEHLTR